VNRPVMMMVSSAVTAGPPHVPPEAPLSPPEAPLGPPETTGRVWAPLGRGQEVIMILPTEMRLLRWERGFLVAQRVQAVY
jgi:hypothetical protein